MYIYMCICIYICIYIYLYITVCMRAGGAANHGEPTFSALMRFRSSGICAPMRFRSLKRPGGTRFIHGGTPIYWGFARCGNACPYIAGATKANHRRQV